MNRKYIVTTVQNEKMRKLAMELHEVIISYYNVEGFWQKLFDTRKKKAARIALANEMNFTTVASVVSSIALTGLTEQSFDKLTKTKAKDWAKDDEAIPIKEMKLIIGSSKVMMKVWTLISEILRDEETRMKEEFAAKHGMTHDEHVRQSQLNMPAPKESDK